MAVFLAVVTGSMLIIAVPEIARTLGADDDEQEWLVAGYALTFGLLQVPGGRLGDVCGRRRVFVGGLVLFGVAGVAAGLAPVTPWLLTAVVVQGGALGAAIPQIYGLIQQQFTNEERGRPYGLLGVAFALAIGSGPILGGLLVDVGAEIGWRLVFAVTAPIALLAAGLGWSLMPTSSTAPDRSWWREIDLVGIVLLIVGVATLWAAMVEDESRTSTLWVLGPIGLVVLAGFVFWERRRARHGSPLFDLGLLRIRSYGLGTLIALLFGAYDALFYVMALYLQNGVNHEPFTAGLVMTPIAVGSAAGSLIGGRVVGRVGRRAVVLGLLMVLVGLAAVVVGDVFLPTFDSPHSAALPLLIAGLGGGFVLSGAGSSLTVVPNQTITMSQVPETQAGSAAGMLQTGSRLGSSAGTIGVSTALFVTVDRTGGNWLAAFRVALLMIAAFIIAALVTTLVDVYTNHGRDSCRPGGRRH
ncbi:MFS transporter [Micromonospora sp. WMMA1363]|uniref:MFS transporter n=1 Tax=Micromonospora sp. WMMA1363 TaxID=3053985 RepID=UPI00259CDDD7|nr:MFS transporter [Micromonospora sp. WMMA1363]MDM4719434.1 MFS transporter [Micromonospora sp. WMMA1363]